MKQQSRRAGGFARSANNKIDSRQPTPLLPHSSSSLLLLLRSPSMLSSIPFLAVGLPPPPPAAAAAPAVPLPPSGCLRLLPLASASPVCSASLQQQREDSQPGRPGNPFDFAAPQRKLPACTRPPPPTKAPQLPHLLRPPHPPDRLPRPRRLQLCPSRRILGAFLLVAPAACS